MIAAERTGHGQARGGCAELRCGTADTEEPRRLAGAGGGYGQSDRVS